MVKKGRFNSILLKQARRAEINRISTLARGGLNSRNRLVTICSNEENLKPTYTFRWDDEKVSPLMPRLLRNGECPQFTGPLRAYVDCTAKGLKPGSMLSQELDKFSGIDQTDAFKEGIRRWHTFSPSKERLLDFRG